jgi:signal transduction histidine kinase
MWGRMFKEALVGMDRFLPNQFTETAEAQLLYRGRVIVATSIASTIMVFILWICCFFLNVSILIQSGFFLCIVVLSTLLFYLKIQTSRFERSLLVGAFFEVLILSTLVYLTAFSAQGMGFFGLIWLIPIFLMMAFYFNTRFSFYLASIHILAFISVSYFKYDVFFQPLAIIPNFSLVFVMFLTLVIVFAYLIAFLFVHLNEELQKEVLKQRDLLVESAKFQSLGQMASNLAHDINNPLFTIQGKLHQMRNLLSRDQLDLERCDQIVESAESTLLRLSQIVKGISTFAREGRGDQMISISVKELIENNLALAMDRIKNLEIELKIEIDPKSIIICYPSFISQVLLNLLNNAIDALDFSDVKVIEVRAYSEKNWVNIAIIDSGPGVPKEIEKKIFDPFFTTKTIGKGTGLGLSISKGLIEVHEGKLLYERSDSRTTFLIKLPSYE